MKTLSDMKGPRDLDAMLAEYDKQPKDWRCPEHEVEYGEGKPDPARIAWACPECDRAANEASQQFKTEHAHYRWWRAGSGIPHRYRSATPAHIKPLTKSAALLSEATQKYVESLTHRVKAGDGLLLLGPPGLGKTLALTAIINAACARMRGPEYVVWSDALADLKAGFNGSRDDERRQAVERLRTVRLLALDELGVKAASEFDHSELFSVIDYRYRNRLPTLAAANSTLAQFPSIVGERISDRLQEVGPVIVLTGESQRGKVQLEGPDALLAPPSSVTVKVHSMGEWKSRRIEQDVW